MSKSKLTALAVVSLLITGASPLSAASAPKPGSNCAKAGLTQTVAGKKYTCTKAGTKLMWNKGVVVATKPTPTATATTESTSAPVQPTAAPSASTASTVALVKFKNCTEAKAAGAAPLTRAKTPELYELNAGLDRDRDGVACES
jgi:hypothetical protein